MSPPGTAGLTSGIKSGGFCFCFLKEKTAAVPRLWPGQVIQRLSPVAVGHGGPRG